MSMMKDYLDYIESNEEYARLWSLRHPATVPVKVERKLASMDEVEGFFDELYEHLDAKAAHAS